MHLAALHGNGARRIHPSAGAEDNHEEKILYLVRRQKQQPHHERKLELPAAAAHQKQGPGTLSPRALLYSLYGAGGSATTGPKRGRGPALSFVGGAAELENLRFRVERCMYTEYESTRWGVGALLRG